MFTIGWFQVGFSCELNRGHWCGTFIEGIKHQFPNLDPPSPVRRHFIIFYFQRLTTISLSDLWKWKLSAAKLGCFSRAAAIVRARKGEGMKVIRRKRCDGWVSWRRWKYETGDFKFGWEVGRLGEFMMCSYRRYIKASSIVFFFKISCKTMYWYAPEV